MGILGISQMKSPVFWRDVLAEIICSTLLLTFLTFNMVEYSGKFSVTPTHAGLVMGFLVCAIIETFGHMGGAHMNPAVTFTLACRRDIPPIKAVIYTLAQCTGGAAGSAIVYGLTSPSNRYLFKPLQPVEEVGVIRGMLIEAFLTFTLCMVIQGVTDASKKTQCNMPGIPIGFTVGVNIMAALTYTGAAFNPIIAFGPAVITQNFVHNWVYWAGAYVGAFFAILIYGLMKWVGKRYGVKKQDAVMQSGTMEEMLQLLQDLHQERETKMNNNKLTSI